MLEKGTRRFEAPSLSPGPEVELDLPRILFFPFYGRRTEVK